MSAMFRIAGDAGTCCECGDVDGCDCRKCSLLECRSRGGIVALGCHAENAGYESTPPRWYKKKIFAGTTIICTCTDACGFDEQESSCTTSATSSSGCEYTVTAEITSVYLDGGTPKYNGRVTFTGGIPGDPICPTVLAEGRYVGGGLFYFGSSQGSGSFSGVGVTTTVCPDNAAPAYFASITTSVAVPGVVGGMGCAVVLQGPLDTVITTTIISYSGERTFNPGVSCVVPSLFTGLKKSSECVSLLCKSTHSACGDTLEGPITDAFADDPFLDAYFQVKDVDATTIHQHTPWPCGDGRGRAANTGSYRFQQLQDEDTDEDGIARLLASPEGQWCTPCGSIPDDGWKVVHDGTGGTCENPSCCRAAWEIRTDREFEYRIAEFRATIEGLEEGESVTIKLKVYRKAYGALLYTHFADLEYDRTADAFGEARVTGVVPNAQGFETYVTCSYS